MKRCGFSLLLCSILSATPQWFEKPTINSNSLYGFGVGETPMKAKQNAIIDLSSSLSSSVNTRIEKNTQRNDQSLSSSATQNISIDSKMEDLIGVKVVKAECVSNQCYSQVEIGKYELLKQVQERIKKNQELFLRLKSPFAYAQKRDVLYPKILADKALYEALSEQDYKMSIDLGEPPTFVLEFEYDGDFSKAFKKTLEQTIQKEVGKNGSIVSQSQYKILFEIFQEDENVGVSATVLFDNNLVENATISDARKAGVSKTFFAQRLGVQISKKMREWGRIK